MNTLSPLDAAKEQLSVPALWQFLNLPGRPGNSCRSPFCEVYDRGRKWKDHATGQGGDAADFLAVAYNLSAEEGARRLIALANVPIHTSERTGLENFVRSHCAEEEKARMHKDWPIFQQPSAAEIESIAELRGLSVEGVSLAADRGLLFCASFREGRSWVIAKSIVTTTLKQIAGPLSSRKAVQHFWQLSPAATRRSGRSRGTTCGASIPGDADGRSGTTCCLGARGYD
jgi:hypothetical protein